MVNSMSAGQYGNFTYTDNGTSITITDYPTTASGAVAIPATIISKPVTTIGNRAFQSCSLITGVTIPTGVITIEGSAFYGCSKLTSVSIPPGVTSLGDSAFYNCSKLTGITIPTSVTSIGTYAFYGCSSLTVLLHPGWCCQHWQLHILGLFHTGKRDDTNQRNQYR